MAKQKITSSSTAEYFSKNLQQVGFSSPTKAVLTTLKEAVDNALDACEDAEILPEITVEIERKGPGTMKNTDLVRVFVEDNGPGLDLDDVPKVFGEYLASSKFGRGRCSRGQQGIGISAATTWAQLTSAKGVVVTTKTKAMRQAWRVTVEVDIRNNKGVIKTKEAVKWDKPNGVSVEFLVDGRIQLNGEGGILTYLLGNTLVNPHLALKYKVPEAEWVNVPRVSSEVPEIPPATEPHPHTMKLGEFIAHSHIFGKSTVRSFLKSGFSRVTDNIIAEFVKNGLNKKQLDQPCNKLKESEFKDIFTVIQKSTLMAPSTRSVMTIGEEPLSKSIRRLGEVDFFSVVTRKPCICDFKPVAVEIAIARLKSGGERLADGEEGPVTVLRFANRVPLQFDKAACAIVKALCSVSWRTYGLNQPKGGLPIGPYVVAVSLVSPFIKFKNASKETIDASDELVEEFRRALIQAGQRLSRHIRKESREADLEKKLQHIEQFCPILVDTLCRITKSPESRKKKAIEGLTKILGREISQAKQELHESVQEFEKAKAAGKVHMVDDDEGGAAPAPSIEDVIEGAEPVEAPAAKSKGKAKSAAKPAAKPAATKKTAKRPPEAHK